MKNNHGLKKAFVYTFLATSLGTSLGVQGALEDENNQELPLWTQNLFNSLGVTVNPALLIRHNGQGLLQAIRNGMTDVAIELVQEGVAVNVSDPEDGATALMLAAENGYSEIVRMLLAAGAQHSARDNEGSTALMGAARNGRLEIVRELVAIRDIDINQANNEGITPLLEACINGHAQIVELLLATKGIRINKPKKEGETPLMHAISKGNAAIVDILLHADVSINAQTDQGVTALMWAAQLGHVAIVKSLLAAGADMRVKVLANKIQKTAIELAVDADKKEIVTLLLAAYEGKEKNRISAKILDAALFNNNSAMVAHLIALGVEVTGKNKENIETRKQGVTPLIFASYLGNASIVRILLEAGAPINLADEGGNTSLIHAALNGRIDVLDVLIKAGADLEAVTQSSQTALLRAVEKDQPAAAEMLIKAGADVHARDDAGYTPLLLAASNGYKELVILLVEAGADIEARLSRDKPVTPLAFAVVTGYKEIAEWLLSKGADTTVIMNHRSLAQWAVFFHHYALARLVNSALSDYELAVKAVCANKIEDVRYFIQERELAVDAADSNGVTLLATAALHKKNSIVLYLLSQGANPFLKTHRGWLPSQVAQQRTIDNASARLIESKMAALEKEALAHGAQLCLQEAAEQAHKEARKKREAVRALLATRSEDARGGAAAQPDTEVSVYTDDPDCDVYALTQSMSALSIAAGSSQRTKANVQKKAAAQAKPIKIDASRSEYAARVEEWFTSVPTALERPEYGQCPEALFPEIIFRHTLARIMDTLTRDWALVDTQGNQTRARLYCIIDRYGIQEEGVLEYALDTQAAKPVLYHRFLNKVSKHPGIRDRFIVSPAMKPSQDSHFRTANRPAADESYIVQVTGDYVEVYDPKNDTTIFVCKPRK